MRTIFGLFEEFDAAGEAISRLDESKAAGRQTNLIVQEESAKSHLEADLEEIKVQKSRSAGGLPPNKLAALLGGKKPVQLYDVGRVYAAGELANMLVNAAAARPGVTRLVSALVEFGLEEGTAESFQMGVAGGGVLFFVRSDDNRASQVAEILQQAGAKYLSSAPHP